MSVMSQPPFDDVVWLPSDERIHVGPLVFDDLPDIVRVNALREVEPYAANLRASGHKREAFALTGLGGHAVVSIGARFSADDPDVFLAPYGDPPMPPDFALLLDVVDAISRDQTLSEGTREVWRRIAAAIQRG